MSINQPKKKIENITANELKLESWNLQVELYIVFINF